MASTGRSITQRRLRNDHLEFQNSPPSAAFNSIVIIGAIFWCSQHVMPSTKLGYKLLHRLVVGFLWKKPHDYDYKSAEGLVFARTLCQHQYSDHRCKIPKLACVFATEKKLIIRVPLSFNQSNVYKFNWFWPSQSLISLSSWLILGENYRRNTTQITLSVFHKATRVLKEFSALLCQLPLSFETFSFNVLKFWWVLFLSQNFRKNFVIFITIMSGPITLSSVDH